MKTGAELQRDVVEQLGFALTLYGPLTLRRHLK